MTMQLRALGQQWRHAYQRYVLPGIIQQSTHSSASSSSSCSGSGSRSDRRRSSAAVAAANHATVIKGYCISAEPPFGSRGFAVKVRNRGNVYVPRKVFRKTLDKATQRQSDPTLLLPPYVAASELRVLFRVDYAGVFRLLGVGGKQGNYFWKDHMGREFQSVSKRKVMVPFDIAALPAQGLGYNPKVLDVEPDWLPTEVKTDGGSTGAVPVVAVLGHINHGKTTLLDALCGTEVAASEPGGITQDVRAMTGAIVEWPADMDPMTALPTGFEGLERRPVVALGMKDGYYAGQAAGDASTRKRYKFDTTRMTFLDTPGHEAFDVQRGRTMASADVAVVVVSVERGAEVQTEEILLHASRWKVPIVFALNKIDLPGAHIDLTRAELRRQCQILYEEGQVDVDWTKEAENAVPISALRGLHLEKLVDQVHEVLNGEFSVPLKPVTPPTSTPGEAKRRQTINRRVDHLSGVDEPPLAVALITEFEVAADNGERILTAIIRAGRLAVGQYFVVGTYFGRITNMAVADGSVSLPSWNACNSATVGVAVRLMGLRRAYGGDCAPDDFLYAFSSERAWRLSEHRRKVEALIACQIAGPLIEVAWEHDSLGMGSRTQAAFERDRHAQPEQHSASAYERRLERLAIEDITSPDSSQQQPFEAVSRRSFTEPLPKGPRYEAGVMPLQPAAGERRDELRSADASEAEAEEARQPRTGGRKSKRAVAARQQQEDEDEQRSRGQEASGADDEAGTGGGGRRSSRAAREAASGAWTSKTSGADTPKEDFVYYTQRSTWQEEGAIDSTRIHARWQERDEARWAEQDRQAQLLKQEKRLAEQMRRQAFGEPPLDEEEELAKENDGMDFDDDEESVEPLPERNVPVVSMVLKTRNVSHFDVLMDEVERVQKDHGVRVVIVHGGLGPVIPKDVTHAEIEKEYGFCPIYAFQVGVTPEAAGQADKESIDLRRYDVFSDLVADVEARCAQIRRKGRLDDYVTSLPGARRGGPYSRL
eukprot:TRINITY_DN112298_c0_g1_i1.p1 TRINITY_DN112298_c0_g1~~TRINITY_DN112298_c0_g1_i1.p1  ORF type:complete len:994 (+),score=180.36 TRINITY_DN112298_c0_g1_i1:87-3068(+)